MNTSQTTQFTDTGLTNGVARFYSVSAVGTGGESARSAEAAATPTATTNPTTPPATPTELTASAGNGQVALSWHASTGASSYRIYVAPQSGGTASLVNTSQTTQFTDTGLTNGVARFYSVSAVGTGGESARSAEAAATPTATTNPTTPPATPTGLTASAGDGRVFLGWHASPGASSYNVYVSSQSGGAFTRLGSSQTTQYADTGLTNGVARFYVVTAVGTGGESARSTEASATPTASSDPFPPAEDRTRNQIGLGVWFNNDWDSASAFADAFKQSRPWRDAQNWNNPVAGVDALGWPTADASTVIFTNPASVVNGTYKLVFKGKARVEGLWCTANVAHQVYDAASNTTAADVTITKGGANECGLVFTETQRTATSPVGSGFTDACLYRPGYPSDGSKVFTDPFLKAFQAINTKVVRMMDWGGGSGDIVQRWADRAKPGSATQGGLPAPPYTDPGGDTYNGGLGVALEHRIQLCNALGADCWINIPTVADDEFVRNTALALRFGTDGVNPYTSPQQHPLFPPLNPNLRVYLEYSNEIWNSAPGFIAFNIIQAICLHLPTDHPVVSDLTLPSDQYVAMWRYPAWRIASISETFRGVFGDAAMMTRVRPVMETQQGDDQGTLSGSLPWLERYAKTLPTPRKVSDLLYGGGGSAYYGVNSEYTSASPDVVFAAGNYPARTHLHAWALDAVWTYTFGLKHVAYEGGPNMERFTDAQNRILNADPRMQTLVQATHDGWSAMGGDLLVYYCLVGPPTWAFLADINQMDSPKLQALVSLQNAPKATVTLGAPLPGTIAVKDPAIWNVRVRHGYGYDVTLNGQPCEAGYSQGEWVGLPGHADQAFAGQLTVRAAVPSVTHMEVMINGVSQGTVTLTPTAGSGSLVDSTPLPVSVPAGLAVVRLIGTDGGFTLHGVTIR